MSEIFKNTLNWIKLYVKTELSLMRIIIYSRNLKQFIKEKTSKKRMVVLGNGPSFKGSIENNKEFFKSEDNELICLNHFAITDYYQELKPKYYFTIAHDLFLDDTLDEYKQASIKLFNAIAEKTDWKLKFFISYEARKEKRWQEILRKNPNIEIVYMNITPVEGFKWFRYWTYNRALGMTRPHNIMIPSIHFAIQSGVKEIILIGSEHSWLKELHVDDDNNALFFNEHFYDDKQKSQKYNNRGGQSFLKLHEILMTLATAFASYHELNEYSKSKGVNIYNCTEGSFIDAFERKSLKDFK